MLSLIKKAQKKVNTIIVSLASTGVLLTMLGILIIFTDFILRILLGTFVLLVAYSFFQLAYKIYKIKKDIEDHFNF